ncbi:hypothetical protein M3Y95_01228700 [Aphelenchoides besseyi]|nr:hypothetical protein M3Y95_01228700 [Aphelenchoides besseyi]
MAVQLNKNCRCCLLTHISKQFLSFEITNQTDSSPIIRRFVLINRKFLSILDCWVLHSFTTNNFYLSLDLSSGLVILFIRLSNLKLLTLTVCLNLQIRPLASTVFRNVQSICNAITDNPMIKRIELVSDYWRQLQLLLYDQLPDRIVKLSCSSYDSVALLRRRCVMDSVEIKEYDLEPISFYHVLQLPCRTFRFTYHPNTELTDSLPLERNDSIETIEMCVYTEFFDHSNQHRFAEVFRILRSINDKLKLRLETRFYTYEIDNNDELKDKFQTFLADVRDLIDSVAAVHLPVESFLIDLGEYPPYDNYNYANCWKDIPELCGFFTSLGFEKDDQKTQKTSTEWTYAQYFSMVYKDTKVITHTNFDYWY